MKQTMISGGRLPDLLTSIENETKKQSNSLLSLRLPSWSRSSVIPEGLDPVHRLVRLRERFSSPLSDQRDPRREIERVQPKFGEVSREVGRQSSNNREFHSDRVDVGQLDCGKDQRKAIRSRKREVPLDGVWPDEEGDGVASILACEMRFFFFFQMGEKPTEWRRETDEDQDWDPRHTPERFGVFPILSQWNEYN